MARSKRSPAAGHLDVGMGGDQRPPRPSSVRSTAGPPAWKVGGKAVQPSGRQAKEEASRMPKTNTFMPFGTLVVRCFDRLTRKPLPGCAVCVSSVESSVKQGGRPKNAASTFGQATVSDEDVSPCSTVSPLEWQPKRARPCRAVLTCNASPPPPFKSPSVHESQLPFRAPPTESLPIRPVLFSLPGTDPV